MWQKNGEIFVNPLVFNGRRIFNPTAEQLTAAGYSEVEPEPAAPDLEFEKVKTAFWGYVQTVAQQLNLPLSDFPTAAYSSELLAWCSEHGLDAATTGDLAIKFCGIAADLARIGRNWNELFEQTEDNDE